MSIRIDDRAVLLLSAGAVALLGDALLQSRVRHLDAAGLAALTGSWMFQLSRLMVPAIYVVGSVAGCILSFRGARHVWVRAAAVMAAVGFVAAQLTIWLPEQLWAAIHPLARVLYYVSILAAVLVLVFSVAWLRARQVLLVDHKRGGLE